MLRKPAVGRPEGPVIGPVPRLALAVFLGTSLLVPASSATADEPPFVIDTFSHIGLPVYTLRGGLSAEYAVQKSLASLTAGVSHSWETPAPGAGPAPFTARPDFLARSIDATIAAYDAVLGAEEAVDTVVLATGAPSTPYIARTLGAPVLPLHFLTGAESISEVESVLDGAVPAAYATLGHDFSLSTTQGVAWIKLLELPEAYRDFMIRRGVKRVVVFGASGTGWGESAARKLTDDSEHLGDGSIYLMQFAGPDADRNLRQTIDDYDPANLDPITAIPDWESAVSEGQVNGVLRDVSVGAPGVEVHHITTNAGDVPLWQLATHLSLAHYQKNEISVRGVSMNPYLIGHPFFESHQGYVPYLYWQGRDPAEVVGNGISRFLGGALQDHGFDVALDELSYWVNSTNNFGGPGQGQAVALALEQAGYASIVMNDFTADEEWDRSDGRAAPSEVRADILLSNSTPATLAQWNDGLEPLDVAEIEAMSSFFGDLVVRSWQPGDFNGDGVVNAADYTVWRDGVGQPATGLANDVDGGIIGPAQYSTWAASYAATEPNIGGGSVLALVPEPNAACLAFFACLARESIRRRRHGPRGRATSCRFRS